MRIMLSIMAENFLVSDFVMNLMEIRFGSHQTVYMLGCIGHHHSRLC